MSWWYTDDIAHIVTGRFSGKRVPIATICTDARQVQPGDLFIALKGEHADGHDYVLQALENDVAAVLVNRLLEGVPEAKQIVVEDTMTAFRQLASYNRERMKGCIIGITGSAGKTTTKEMLRHVLKKFGRVFANIKSYNNHVGVPLSLVNCDPQNDFAVFEMGMNVKGEISALTCLVRPDIAIITNIYPVHVGPLGGLRNIALAKAEIFEGLKKAGIAVINGDTAYVDLLKEKAAQAAEIITVGEIDHNDVFLTSYAVKGSGIEVTASILGEPVSLALTFRGKHYVLNALVALLLAKKLGLDLQKACAALETFHLLDNRGAVKEIALPQGHVTLIDESYNANPVAVKCAIDRLKDIGEGRRKVLILGEMGELGHEAVAYHEALAPFIKEAAIDRVYVVGGETIKALYDLLPVTMRGAHYVSVHDIPHDFVARLLDQDVLLVKGSLVRQLGLFVKRLEQYAPKEKGHAV